MTDAKPKSSGSVRRLEVVVDTYEEPFKFTIALSDWQDFQREAQRDAALAANNLLLRTVTDPSREDLIEYFKARWGLPGILMDQIATELVGMKQAHLKNSTSA